MKRRSKTTGERQSGKCFVLLAVCLFSWNVFAHEGEDSNDTFATGYETDSGLDPQEKSVPNSPTIGPQLPTEQAVVTPVTGPMVPAPVVATPFVPTPVGKSAPRSVEMRFASRASLLAEGPNLFKSLGLASEMFRTRLGYGQALKTGKPVAVQASATPVLSEDFFQKVERTISSVLPTVVSAGPEWKEEATPKETPKVEITKSAALSADEDFEKTAETTGQLDEENQKDQPPVAAPNKLKIKASRRLLSTVKEADRISQLPTKPQ